MAVYIFDDMISRVCSNATYLINEAKVPAHPGGCISEVGIDLLV